ncbi:MAG: glycosyltransferase family 4 protein, partial [Cyanobacteria bacterium K_DeepCast_35m_m1_288]|nr:glycosyltransferase family 4 protein [Cyanobacteria bacterium K_DeepCast_35m_m1_288]
MGQLAVERRSGDGRHVEQHDQQPLAHHCGASPCHQETQPWLIKSWLPCYSDAALALLVYKDLIPEEDALLSQASTVVPPAPVPLPLRRVLLVANTSWYLYNFRLPLIRDLQRHGYAVALVAPYDAHTPLLQSEGFCVHNWLVARSSVNPLSEAHALMDLWRIYEREQPDLVHHFTIKACLYGTIAAKAARVYRVINAVTGLGHVFLGTRRRSRLLRRGLRPLYSAVFKARRSTVVFQNADDQDQLIQLGITDGERARLIRGSGVDIDHFKPLADSAGHYQSPLQLLFPSRLINEKGVRELLQACRSLWAEGLAMELVVAGALDSGNRSALSAAELAALQADPRVRCLGHVADMRELYAASDMVVLPSWREGLSRALIEAAAMERPIITTDVPGCRDVVDHGRSGLLVPLRDARSLELAIRLFIDNPDLARRCG